MRIILNQSTLISHHTEGFIKTGVVRTVALEKYSGVLLLRESHGRANRAEVVGKPSVQGGIQTSN